MVKAFCQPAQFILTVGADADGQIPLLHLCHGLVQQAHRLADAPGQRACYKEAEHQSQAGQRKANRTHGAHGRGADGCRTAQQDVEALGRFPGPQIFGINPLFLRPALARYGVPYNITDFTLPVFRPGTVKGLLVGIQYQQRVAGRIKTVQQVVEIFPGKVQHHIPGSGTMGALQRECTLHQNVAVG